MASRFLRELERRVLVFDGSMGATIQAMPLSVERDYLGRENCVDILVKSRPDIVGSIHDSFLAAGALLLPGRATGPGLEKRPRPAGLSSSDHEIPPQPCSPRS